MDTVDPVNIIEDRIRGMIFGHALGDACAVSNRFKFKKDITIPIVFPYKEPIREYPVCDWTSCTDMMILIMQELIENKGMPEYSDNLARKFSEWLKGGFSNLGDTRGLGASGLIAHIINHKDFTVNPVKIAAITWEISGCTLASNDSLARTSIIGAMPKSSQVYDTAINISTLTHVDKRCLAACALQSILIHKLIHRGDDLDIDKLLYDSVAEIKNILPTTDDTPTYETELSSAIQTGYTRELSGIDESGKCSHVLTCLECSMYALQVIKAASDSSLIPSFKKVIRRVISEGGDTCSNASVVGALIGAFIGYSKLPQRWLDAMPNKEWLNEITTNYISTITSLPTSTADVLTISDPVSTLTTVPTSSDDTILSES